MKTADDFPLGSKVKWREESGSENVGVVIYHHDRCTVIVEWTTKETTFISTGVLELM